MSESAWARFAARLDALLTAERVRAYAFVFLGLGMLAWAGVIVAGHPPLDAFGRPVAVDFSAHYTAGRMVLDGQSAHLYAPQAQRAYQASFLPGVRQEFLDLFLSPPFVAFLYAPLAALPYLAAAAFWSALSVAMLLASLQLLWPLLPALHGLGRARVFLIALSAAPVLELLGDGQDSALALLIAVGALRLLLAKREIAGGVVLGLGAFKPQLFFLLPVLLLFERRWRALSATTAVTLALAWASVAAVGRAGLSSYAALLGGELYRQRIVGDLSWKMQSLPALLRTLLPALPGWTTALVALVTSIAAAIALARLARSSAAGSSERFALHYALALLAAQLASPHLFLYDCVLLIVPAALLLNADHSRALRFALVALYLLLWTAPFRVVLATRWPPLHGLAAPWSAVILLALLVVGIRVETFPAHRRSEFDAQ